MEEQIQPKLSKEVIDQPKEEVGSDSDASIYDEEQPLKIPKFDIEKYKKKTERDEERLRSEGKGRRGIRNYDTYCRCFERQNRMQLQAKKAIHSQGKQSKSKTKMEAKIASLNCNKHLVSA